MAFTITQNSDDIAYGLTQYVCDTEADIKDVPVNAAMGSILLVISTSDVYILNSNREWKKL